MLYHGSPARIEGPIRPSGDYPVPGMEGKHPVVYATPSAGWALVFATAQDRNSLFATQSMMSDNGTTITIYRAGASLELHDSGYVYEVPDEGFTACSPAEFVSLEPVAYERRYLVHSSPFASFDETSRLTIDVKGAAAFIEGLSTTRRLMQGIYEGFGFGDRFEAAFAVHESVPCVGTMAKDILHGYFHALRTSLLANLIYLLSEPGAEQTPAELALGAALHDVGRFSEPDSEHGEAGARWVLAHAPLAGGADAQATAELVRGHCIDPDSPNDPFELTVLKDADAADRMRFLIDSQRPKERYLRLPATARIIAALEEVAEELYAREYRLQRVFLAARSKSAESGGRRFVKRPEYGVMIGATLKAAFKGEAAGLLGCSTDDAIGTWRSVGIRDDSARVFVALPLTGDAPSELRIQANPWITDRDRLYEGAPDELRRLLSWDAGAQSHSAAIVWGETLGAEGGLTLAGATHLRSWWEPTSGLTPLFALMDGGSGLFEGALRLEERLPAGWLLDTVLVRDGAGSMALCPKDDRTRMSASALDGLADALGVAAPRADVGESIAHLTELGFDWVLTLGLSADGGGHNGSHGISLRWARGTVAMDAGALIDPLRELGLADGRAELCGALAVQTALDLVDENGSDYQVILSVVPQGADIAWGGDGRLLESTFLLGIIARIA